MEKVNWIKVCTVGIKVILAVGTGIAVFAGIAQATKAQQNGNASSNNNNDAVNADNNIENNSYNVPNVQSEPSKSAKVATGLKATQASLEKIVSVFGALSVAAESLSAVFGPTPTFYRNQNAPWTGMGRRDPRWNYTGPNDAPFIGTRQNGNFIEVGYPEGYCGQF